MSWEYNYETRPGHIEHNSERYIRLDIAGKIQNTKADNIYKAATKAGVIIKHENICYVQNDWLIRYNPISRSKPKKTIILKNGLEVYDNILGQTMRGCDRLSDRTARFGSTRIVLKKTPDLPAGTQD